MHFIYLREHTVTPSSLQLFMVLLEVEEMARVKNTVLTEAEETKLIAKSQGKVEYIYSELQHHNPL